MVQPGNRLGFALEADDIRIAIEGAAQHLQGDDSVERNLLGTVNDSHAARTDTLLDTKVTDPYVRFDTLLVHDSTRRFTFGADGFSAIARFEAYGRVARSGPIRGEPARSLRSVAMEQTHNGRRMSPVSQACPGRMSSIRRDENYTYANAMPTQTVGPKRL
jgi:hypothetical protein